MRRLLLAAWLVVGLSVTSVLYGQALLLLGLGSVVVEAQSNAASYRLTADAANSTTTFSDVSDLSWSIAVNAVQIVECSGAYTTAVSTTAMQIALNGPASPANLRTTVEMSTTATARHNASQSAYDTVTNPATGGAATALPFTLRATIENGANAGTVVLRVRSEIGTSAVTILRGASCRVVTL